MKKTCLSVLLSCCFLTATAHAKDVYYEKFRDSKTGRYIEYIDLYEDTPRPYFTQNMWFSDNNSFIIGGRTDGQLYKYDISSKTVEPLFDEKYLPIDSAATVGFDDTVYAKNNKAGYLYAKKVVPEDEKEEINPLSMTLPLLEGYEDSGEPTVAGTAEEYTENGLTFAIINDDSLQTAMTVVRQYGGKWCRTTVAQNRKKEQYGGKDWYEISTTDKTSDGKANLRNYLTSSYHTFRVDNSKLSSDTKDITIEFDLYDNNDSLLSGSAIKLIYLGSKDDGTTEEKTISRGHTYSSTSSTNAWKTVKVTLTDAQFDHSFSDNGFAYDFRIGASGNRGGVAITNVKVYPTPVDDVRNLGNAQGGWLPHVAKNGDVTMTTGERQTIAIYDSASKMFTSPDIGIYSTHAMINPVYPNLVLYTYDNSGDANQNFSRIRLYNRDTGEKKILFDQYSNASGGATTGEAVGHEGWSLNGEYIAAVKYQKDSNIGKSGIIRMDKNGENREYLNDDYNYWHCSISHDGRWIVADTLDDITNIVLIDAKTGKSYLLARQPLFWNDPGQPHPSFSADGNYVTFAMARRKLGSNYVIGVGIIDISDIVNDGQIPEPEAPTDFTLSPFKIDFNEALNKNEVSTTVDNLDGRKRNMNLYAAVFDGERLVSVNKGRYDSSDDATLSAEIGNVNAGETLKFFLWNDNAEPIKSSTDTIKQLRGAKVGPNAVVLSWQHDTDMPVLKYEVYRDGTKIGETPDMLYRDFGLTKETQYTYYVRPVYNAFHVGEDGESITVNTNELNLNGINYQALSTSVAGSKTGIRVRTSAETMYSTLAGEDITQTGMQFVYNPVDTGKDGHTKEAVIGGMACRKSTSDATSMFCFKLDKRIVPEENNTEVDITVEYYDSGSGKIQLIYPATDGTIKTVDVASLGYSLSWKTATVNVEDAKFNASLNRDSDFVIKPTKADTYIYSVSVVKKSASAPKSQHQYVEWSTSADSGLTRTSGGEISGEFAYLNSSTDLLKFSVDDNYMYGSGDNMAWIDITYKDYGTSNIYLYYNTSDPTAKEKGNKKARDVIKCTNTGEIKTARIPLIDASFANYDGHDFMIGTDNNAHISKVRVLGY